MPAWWIFTPPSEFLPHLENFIHNPKNVRDTITIANTNIFVGGKFPPPPNLYPPKNYPPAKYFDSSDSCKFYFLENLDFFLSDLNSKIFTPGVKFFEFDNKYIIRCLLLKYRLIFLLVFLYLTRLKARQILSRLIKNISLYFKRRHLIIYNYPCLKNGVCLSNLSRKCLFDIGVCFSFPLEVYRSCFGTINLCPGGMINLTSMTRL